jgi:hypothetical protein
LIEDRSASLVLNSSQAPCGRSCYHGCRLCHRGRCHW